MAKKIEIPISTPFNAKGSTDAAKALAALAKAEGVAAQSSAKTAQAQSQAAVAAQKLAQAQNQTATSAVKTTQAQSAAAAQAARTEVALIRLAAAQEKAARGGDSLGQSLSKLVSAAGTLGIAFGAQQIIQGGIALAQTGAQAEQTAARFNQLASAAGQSGDQILAALQKASGGQISDLNLQLAANRANLLGVATSAEDLGVLMEIARDRAQSLGTTATDAFNDLVVGLGRGSPLILDNLGIMVKVGAANEAYAASVGKTVAQLTDAEKKQALINQVVADGRASLEQTGGAAQTTAAKFEALGVAAENAGNKLGGALANTLSDAAVGGAVVLDALIAKFNEMGAAQAQLGDNEGLVRASASYAEYAAQVQQLSAASGNAFGNINALSEAQFNQAKAAQVGTSGGSQWAAVQTQGASAADEAATAATASSEALAKELTEKQTNTAQTELLKQAQADLANLGGSVANGMQTAGQAAILLSAKYGMALSVAEALINAQARLAGGAGGGNRKLTFGQSKDINEQRKAGGGPQEASNGAQAYVKGLQDTAKATQEARAAQEAYNLKIGGSAAVLANLRGQLNQANLTEAQRIEILGKIYDAEQGAAKAGGARASAAEGIARKLVDIEQDAADKIVAINQKMLAEQETAARKLAGSIASITADMIADQEADDLDLIGAKEENIAKLQAREAAQANARIAQAAAVSEAQATAANGDAALAEDVLNIRESAISKQTALDEEYNNRRNELAGDDEATAALKQQYDEATQAASDATAVRVGLAQSEAEQKKLAVEAEKQAALTAAAEAGQALLDTGKKASASADQVNALIGRLNAIPTNITTTINVKTTGSGAAATSGGSSGGTAKAAGGGSFVTSGPTTFTVGDNPGGIEAVSVVPLSGMGSSSVSGNVAKLAGGGTVVVDAAAAAQKALDDANKRAQELAGSTVGAGSKKGGGGGGGGSAAAAEPADPTAAIEKALSLLDKIADLRDKLAEVGPPLNMETVNALADEAAQATQIMGSRFVQLTKEQGDNFAIFTGALEDAISALSDAAGLRNDLVDVGPPIDEATVNALADTALAAATALGTRFKQISKKEGDAIGVYTDAASKSLSLLADVGKVSKQAFSDYQAPSDAEIAMFVADADRVVKAIDKAAQVYSTEGLTAAGTFADTAGKVFDTIGKGLEVFDKIRFGDLSVDPANLKLLEASTLAVLDTTQTIAARAAQIPSGDLSALGLATSAINAQAEALINLSAVPFGNLQGAAGGLQSSGGAISITNYITATPGMDINALTNTLMQKISSQLGARR